MHRPQAGFVDPLSIWPSSLFTAHWIWVGDAGARARDLEAGGCPLAEISGRDGPLAYASALPNDNPIRKPSFKDTTGNGKRVGRTGKGFHLDSTAARTMLSPCCSASGKPHRQVLMETPFRTAPVRIKAQAYEIE
jgi:hypothetical protein